MCEETLFIPFQATIKEAGATQTTMHIYQVHVQSFTPAINRFYLFQYFTTKIKKNIENRFTLDFICLFHHTFPLMYHSYIK